jgi:nucleoside-diphosphate-sugar epimerase
LKTEPSRILITGATGQIGSELVPELSQEYGHDNVVAAGYKKSPDQEIRQDAIYEILDVTDKNAILKIVDQYDVNIIYHLAGILSAQGEKNPEQAWQVNVTGLHNILDVAKEHEIQRLFWPSSIAVFGTGVPRKNTPQNVPLVPNTIYGVSKVAGELLCNYYFHKYNLDVRSIRYPGIISNVTPPGGGTTDYAVEIFYEAIRKKHYTCFVRKDTILPMLYMPDGIRAGLDLMRADVSRIKVRTSYNLAGLSFRVEQLANEIKKHIPDFTIDYQPDFRQEIADSWPMSVDDTAARKDWNWKPEYDLATMTKDMIEKLSRRLLPG